MDDKKICPIFSGFFGIEIVIAVATKLLPEDSWDECFCHCLGDKCQMWNGGCGLVVPRPINPNP